MRTAFALSVLLLSTTAFADPTTLLCTEQHGESSCVSHMHPCTPMPPTMSPVATIGEDKLVKVAQPNGSFKLEGLVIARLQVGPKEYQIRVEGEFDAASGTNLQLGLSGAKDHTLDGSAVNFSLNGPLTLSQNTWSDRKLTYDQSKISCVLQ